MAIFYGNMARHSIWEQGILEKSEFITLHTIYFSKIPDLAFCSSMLCSPALFPVPSLYPTPFPPYANGWPPFFLPSFTSLIKCFHVEKLMPNLVSKYQIIYMSFNFLSLWHYLLDSPIVYTFQTHHKSDDTLNLAF